MEGSRANVNKEKLDRLHSTADQEIIERVEEVAKARGLSMAQVAFMWCADEVTAPIVGISKTERLKEYLGVIDCHLTGKEKQYLEEPYVPKNVEGFDQNRLES